MKRNKRFSWMTVPMMIMLLAVALATAACGNANGGSASDSQSESSNGQAQTGADNASKQAAADKDSANQSAADTGSASAAEAAKETAYPLTVKDDTGTELTFNAAPQKIVTLVPSETEVVYALDGGDRIVAVDDYSNYPADAASKEKIGDMDANIEKIASLKPDLVLASSSMSPKTIESLRKLKLPVYATEPKTYDAVIGKIKNIGVILNKQAKAEEVAGHMRDVRQQIETAVKDAPKPKVYLEFSPGWTVGKNTFLDELITIAGGANIADQPDWYQIDPEAVIKANPDFILYASQDVKEGEKNPILAAIESRPGWNKIAAVSGNKMYELPQDPLVRVGPRLADGLLDMAKKLHPDLIK